MASRAAPVRVVVRRAALVVVGLTVALLVAEAAVRALTDEGPSSTVRDAAVSRRYVRSFEGRVRVDEADRSVLLRFNRDGFRGPDRPQAKPAGVRRVAVLGDSMVAAVGTDEERTFVALVEESLARAPGAAPAEVMNFGVAGSSPGIESVLFENLVARCEPDVVLCVWFAGNDFSDDCAEIGGRRQVAYDLGADGRLVPRPLEGATPALSEWLTTHSRLYVWQKSVTARIRADGDGAADGAAGGLRPGLRAFDGGPDAALTRGWALQEAILGRLAERVRTAGGTFGIVLLPEAAQVYDDVWRDALAAAGPAASAYDAGLPAKRLSAIAKKLGVEFTDLTLAFRAAAPHATVARRDEWLFMNGTGHLNDAGHRVVADALTPAVRGLLDGRRDPSTAEPPKRR